VVRWAQSLKCSRGCYGNESTRSRARPSEAGRKAPNAHR
jgi:hypothetical protein